MDILGQVLLARLLGPQVFGLYAIGWTVLQMVGQLTPLGLDKGVIHYASRFWRVNSSKLKGVLFQAIGLAVLSGLLMGGSLYLAAPWLAEQVFKKPDLVSVIRWFSPALVVFSGLSVAAAATTVTQRMEYAVLAQDLTQPAVNLLLVVLFFLMGMKLSGAVAAGTVSFIVAFTLALLCLKHLFPETFSCQLRPIPVGRKLLAFSLPASFAGVFSMYVVRVDRLIVGYFRPAAEVGIYQAASRSSVLFGIIMSAFSAIFSPMISTLYHKKEMGRLDELFKISTKWGLYSILPLFLVICFVPREIMTVVFGSKYENGYLPLVILAVGQLINVGTGAVGLLLIMTGHQNHWFLISAVMLFTNIALNWLLIPRLGLVGAALGTVCAVGGLFSLGLFQVKRSLGLWPYDGRYLKGLLATALSAAALFLLGLVDVGSQMVKLLLTLIVSSGVFVTTLLLLGLDSEDRDFIRLVRARLGLG
jgi:O-antigen/teichoic acid export membrane protein